MADTASTTTNAPSCTPLEQEVLDEYALLLDNLNKVLTHALSQRPQPESYPQLKCPLTSRDLAVLPTQCPRRSPYRRGA